MVMIEGYFDESGDLDKPPGVFSISGYFLTAENARAMDAAWEAVLLEHGIPYFHMVDCAHGNGVFKGKSSEERTEIEKKLIALIKKHTIEGMSFLTTKDSFDDKKNSGDVYSDCASGCIEAIKIFLRDRKVEGEIAYFFEAGHKSKGHAYAYVAKQLEGQAASLTFEPKEKLRLLQAADLLAWQSTKYLKDWLIKPKPPRRDLASLLEHNHIFYYFGLKARPSSDGPRLVIDKGGMGIEPWPLSRRS